MKLKGLKAELQQRRNEWILELILWVITALIVLMVLMPVWTMHLKYPIIVENIFGIVLAFQVTRLLFLHPYVPYMKSVRSKVGVLLFGLLVLVFALRYFSGVVYFIKDVGFYPMFSGMEAEAVWALERYMKSQLILSYTAALLGLILLPIVLIRVIWKQYNHR